MMSNVRSPLLQRNNHFLKIEEGRCNEAIGSSLRFSDVHDRVTFYLQLHAPTADWTLSNKGAHCLLILRWKTDSGFGVEVHRASGMCMENGRR